MDFPVEIEYWHDANGKCEIAETIVNLPAEHQAWITKRDEFFESLTFQQLRMTKFFGKAKGSKYPLLELKYAGSKGMNYRMLCVIWKQKLIGLVFFQGSGSGGELNKHFSKAIALAEAWKIKNP